MKKLIDKIKAFFQNFFKPKTDYKALYENELKTREHFEFKYNTLRRKIEEAIQ